ncbi:DUF2946 domain-containing protein [Aquipseudomonas campi]|uniref:DUF2946 domain-containing protein n=1 Tax=Aquipseudomonas campi TaxID=2731681 RepID=A0A6M8FCR9_9GAMM|nr:DUF2946 domain-containing protein [Pseudomonas campi]QKE61912.1 DUF2946 domain-containing protein [Pseudomonas campi]
MKISRSNRALATWTLYCSLLLGLFACGLHHGQMSGLALSGLGGAFCSLGSDAGPGIDLDGSKQGAAQSPMGCPLCSSFGASVAVNTAGWGLALPPIAHAPLPIANHWAQPPPRFLRHSLNPRASPLISLA